MELIIFDDNEDLENIEHFNYSIIEIEFDDFIIEYNEHTKTFKLVPYDLDTYDIIEIDGTFIDEDTNETYCKVFDKDIKIENSTLTVKEFYEIKNEIISK